MNTAHRWSVILGVPTAMAIGLLTLYNRIDSTLKSHDDARSKCLAVTTKIATELSAPVHSKFSIAVFGLDKRAGAYQCNVSVKFVPQSADDKYAGGELSFWKLAEQPDGQYRLVVGTFQGKEVPPDLAHQLDTVNSIEHHTLMVDEGHR